MKGEPNAADPLYWTRMYPVIQIDSRPTPRPSHLELANAVASIKCERRSRRTNSSPVNLER